MTADTPAVAVSDYLSSDEQAQLACECGHRLGRHTEQGCTECGACREFQRTFVKPDRTVTVPQLADILFPLRRGMNANMPGDLEPAARHLLLDLGRAGYEVTAKASYDPTGVGPEWTQDGPPTALQVLDIIDGIVDDTHPEGDGCPLCVALDELRAALDRAAAGEPKP